jgi:hypothetical protein
MRRQKDRSERVKEYLDEHKGSLGLQEWRIIVSKEPAPDDSFAATEALEQSQSATIWLGTKFWASTLEEQRLTLIHELLHLDTWRCANMVDRLEDQLGKVAWAMFEPLWLDEWERLIDRHATRIASQFPVCNFA